MKLDERGLPLSTDSDEAVRLFDRSVEHYLKYHIDTMALAGKAIEADPGFAMAHCLKGYLLLSAANPAYGPADRRRARSGQWRHDAARTTARGCIRRMGKWRTRQIIRDLAADPGRHPDRPAGAAHLRHHLVPHGQTAKICEQADRIAPLWPADMPGYDMMQCVWAFAHEETGDYDGAERAVMRRGSAIRPITSRITSRRTSWRWLIVPAKAATGYRRKSPTGRPATT